MRNILLALAATAVMTAPMVTAVRAEDTTIIKRDGDEKTVIKKKTDDAPREEHKTVIIKKDHD